MIACSACRTILPLGATLCPGCGLQLTAQAVPVARRRASGWRWLLMGVAVFFLLCFAGEQLDRQRAADAERSFSADLAAGKLSTPAAFEARCGAASSMSTTKRGTELHYYAGDGEDYYVTLGAGAPDFRWGQGHAPADPAVVRSALHCQ